MPESRAASFDVPGWVAGLGTGSPLDVELVGERERAGLLTVTYRRDGEAVKVRVRRVGGVVAAAWELIAEAANGTERIVVPGGIRFIWRRPSSDLAGSRVRLLAPRC